MHIAAPFSVSTGRRVCADTSRPLRRAPPAERGRAVALYRYGCRRRGPPTPWPACRQRGGLFIGGTDRSYPTAPPRPIRAFPCVVLFPVPSVLRRPPCPTLSVLSFGLSRPGERLPAVPLVLAHPHPPALSVLRRAWCPGGTVRLYRPPCPTLIRAFVRCLSAGLSPPGSRRRVCRRVCRHRGAFGNPFVLALPPRPARLVLWRASLFRRYRPFFGGRRARPISAFVRSPFGGRWPSRIPIAA